MLQIKNIIYADRDKEMAKFYICFHPLYLHQFEETASNPPDSQD